jgi:transcriptional regulator with XRE-family HTH domain
MIKKAFGERVRILRKESGMTQESLSVKSGLAFRFIQDIEAGNKQPTITSIFKIADALGVVPGNLLDDDFLLWQKKSN